MMRYYRQIHWDSKSGLEKLFCVTGHYTTGCYRCRNKFSLENVNPLSTGCACFFTLPMVNLPPLFCGWEKNFQL